MNIMSKSKKAKTCTANGHSPMVNDVRERRLMKELQDITNNATTFTVELVNDNLFEWHVSNYKLPILTANRHFYEGAQHSCRTAGVLLQKECPNISWRKPPPLNS